MKKLMIRLGLPIAGLALALLLIGQSRGVRGCGEETASAPVLAAPPVRVVAEGRIVTYPGAEVEVGTEMAGVIARVAVGEKQEVRRGELLAELRAGDLLAERREALARVAEAQADLRLYEAEHGRMRKLTSEAVESQESMDRAERNREAAAAKLVVAEATVQRIDAITREDPYPCPDRRRRHGAEGGKGRGGSLRVGPLHRRGSHPDTPGGGG